MLYSKSAIRSADSMDVRRISEYQKVLVFETLNAKIKRTSKYVVEHSELSVRSSSLARWRLFFFLQLQRC